MCGRFNLTDPAAVQARFDFVDWHERRIEPKFNIAPAQDILTIAQQQDGAPLAQDVSWGLAPHWLRSGSSKPPINARAETVASSGLFRGALARTDAQRRRSSPPARTRSCARSTLGCR
jgi:putative SOS response-associated peptidase YedK